MGLARALFGRHFGSNPVQQFLGVLLTVPLRQIVFLVLLFLDEFEDFSPVNDSLGLVFFPLITAIKFAVDGKWIENSFQSPFGPA